MPTLAELIVRLLEHEPGLIDREITDNLRGHSANQQPINQKCHDLENRGVLSKRRRADGLIGNYLVTQSIKPVVVKKVEPVVTSNSDGLSEDEVKRFLEKWLVAKGWQVQVAWGHNPGVDIEARQPGKHWLIEVKGCGSRQPMRVNYFLGVIGEILQHMDDPKASYSIAFPDMGQFRRLWDRLPALAKQRTGLSALFVAENGNVISI